MSTEPAKDQAAEQLKAIADSTEKILEALNEYNVTSKKLLWEAQVTRRTLDTIRVAAAQSTLHEVQEFVEDRQLSFVDTLDSIGRDGLSFARFGDGEMRLMLRPDYKLKFQKNSPELADDLRRVLVEPSDSLLVGFPHLYRDNHWSAVWCDIWPQMKNLVCGDRTFGNSHVSRPVFFQHAGDAGVAAWRKIWAHRNVTVITGRNSRFDLNDALFDNIAGVQYLYSSPTNAYSELETILRDARRSDSDLFLISLGPAGTVLARWLSLAGRQAIDIGHISDSYANVYEGGQWPEHKSAIIAK